MKFINLGGSGLQASGVALGCMRILDLSAAELDKLIHTSLDSGINFFDHADIYGNRGGCEEHFGNFLAANPGMRQQMLIQSKCGIRTKYFDFSKEHILSSVDASLKRLKTDYLDVLLLHRPDTLMEPEEVAEAFHTLLNAGKVRQFGVSNHNPAQIELLQNSLPNKLIVNQLQFGPAHTPIIDCGINVNIKSAAGTMHDGSVLEFCRLNNITIQTWSPFLYGFFEGVFLKAEQYAELNKTLGELGVRYQLSRAAMTVAWIARHPANIQTIAGAVDPTRISDMCKGADVDITREEWYQIYRSAGNIIP